MRVTKFAVERPVTTAMLFLGLVMFGLLSYARLSVNMMPDLNLPAMAINTYHLGATPEEIESEITEPMERELATISGLKLLQSYSMPDVSMVFVQFKMGRDKNEALNEVKSKLDLVIPDLPKNAERPLIQFYSMNDAPVIDLVITGDMGGNELYDYADRIVKDRISRIEGVSKINLDGGEIREIKVLADKRTMYDVQMNLSDIADHLKASNVKLSGGDFVNEHREYSIEAGNRFESVDEIRNSFLSTPVGTKSIGDFARVVDSIQQVKSRAILYDLENQKRHGNIVSLGIMKNSTANAVKVAREVKEMLPELQELLPEGVTISVPFDASEYVESAVNDALMNVGLGILITALILLFFLNDIRTTVIVSISVPVSLIATFMAIKQFGGSLNMMTLMSFSVAIGALISNSIVVIENIVRLKKQGHDIKTASVEGTREVMMAVIASTGTNLVVFLPIAAMTSITGAFFKEYALTISAATVFSLIVSFMVTPMLASVLLKKDRKPSLLSVLITSFFNKLEEAYERSLKRLISRRRNPIILFAVMFVFFLMSAGLLAKIGFEFEPQEDNGDVYLELEMVSGTSLERSAELIESVEDIIQSHEEVKVALTILGSKNSFTNGTNFANAQLKLYPKEDRDISNVEFAKILREELEQIPQIIPVVSTVSSDEGAPLQFNLQSSNSEDLRAANDMVVEEMEKIESLLSYESSFRTGNPIIHLEPRKHLLAELGLSSLDVAMTLRNAIYGVKATVLKENGKEYDITISFPQDQVNSLDKIEAIPLFTPMGTYTIGQLADVSYKTSQAQIMHMDKVKTIEFSGNPAPGEVMGDVRNEISAALEQIELPQTVSYSWAGNVKELDETVDDMVITFTIALLLMYMLLASLLENFWQPIIIFTTVPMAMIGVFVFMYLGGHTMNIMSLMAIVTLIGLVVNDDILIHDYTEQLKRKGMEIKEATLLAGKRKMKTVIMTTVAIIFGMLPNALGIGDAGSAYRVPMAIVTIGGMITSTILTLYLIPSLFYLVATRKKKLQVETQ